MSNKKLNIKEVIVNKFNLKDSKLCNIFILPDYLKLEDEENLLQKITEYRQAVGLLLYISTITRPDNSALKIFIDAKNFSGGKNFSKVQLKKDRIQVRRLMGCLRITKDLESVVNSKTEQNLTYFANAILGIRADKQKIYH